MIFPSRRSSDLEFSRVERLGAAVAERLDAASPPTPFFRGLGAASVNERYVIPELLGRYWFRGWAALLHRLGRLNRSLRWVGIWLFMLCLVGMILVALPFMVVVALLLRPIVRGPLRSYVVRLKEPSGA